MKVFLDTNVFYNNWFVANANFKLLFHYLNNERNDLLVSDLVVLEVNNIRERELSETTSEIKKLIKKGSKLNEKELRFSTSELGISPYDVSAVLNEKVYSVKNYGYNSIAHSDVVNRALNSIKPFTGQEKGYRDTLIWLSFLNYLKENDIRGDVAYITNNKHDFFETKNKSLVFNNDLKKDIEDFELNANIIPYLNVYNFVNDKVDKIEHSFDKDEILDDLEDFLIEETEEYLNNMKNHDISDLLYAKVFSEKLTSVIDIESDIFEGLEDPDVQSVSRLPESNVYINCYYEMRRVDLVITIDAIEYKQYADDIESIKSIYDIEIEGDVARLSFICRLNIDASFEYDTESETGSNLTIHYIQSKS